MHLTYILQHLLLTPIPLTHLCTSHSPLYLSLTSVPLTHLCTSHSPLYLSLTSVPLIHMCIFHSPLDPVCYPFFLLNTFGITKFNLNQHTKQVSITHLNRVHPYQVQLLYQLLTSTTLQHDSMLILSFDQTDSHQTDIPKTALAKFITF